MLYAGGQGNHMSRRNIKSGILGGHVEMPGQGLNRHDAVRLVFLQYASRLEGKGQDRNWSRAKNGDLPMSGHGGMRLLA